VRPNGSLSLVYDHRDPLAALARTIVQEVQVFAPLTDVEKTACADGSPKLFTLSGVHAATRELLLGPARAPDEARTLAVTFVHAHAVALQAIGRVGCALVRARPDDWPRALDGLATMNWLRSNVALWEGRALLAGRVSKSGASAVLTANALKAHLGLALGPEELRLEEAYRRAPVVQPRAA
jgi:DNA sulfur modification protein DndB